MLYGESESRRIADGIGVESRPIVSTRMCSSDLCLAAAKALVARLGSGATEIGAVIMVTQTPDYVLPATACLLQQRLGLPTTVGAFDVNLGCSGYVYGLWLAYSLVCSGCPDVLLLVGDTVSRLVRPEDRSTFPLFGDAGTATLVGRCDAACAAHFVLGTDGAGGASLIVRNVGFRCGANLDATEQPPRLEMNGAEVFAFTLREVPPLVRQVLQAAGWTWSDCDAVVLHQANGFILEHLRTKIGVPKEKFMTHIREYGNTSSASIPLELVVGAGPVLQERACRLILAGFGVGFSWASAAIANGPMVVVPVIEVDE